MKKPWIIYGQDGEAVAKLKVGSVRFGRTMRAAIEIERYTMGRVFLSQDEIIYHEDGKVSLPKPDDRHYVWKHMTAEDMQARNRRQLMHA